MARSKKKKDDETEPPPHDSEAQPLATEPEPDLTIDIDEIDPPQALPFPVVGIGASAGGLEALEEFLTYMPPDSGLAFVVVMHLDPSHDSMLPSLLQKYTQMDVVKIEDGMPLQPNRVHVIPPNRELGLLNGQLQLMQVLPEDKFRLVIDIFFRHLADDQGRHAICIILSGSGSDGTLGLRDINEKGGMVMVQEPETASHNGMPRSAVAAGLADYILPPGEMPAALMAYIRRTDLIDQVTHVDSAALDTLNKIFLLLRAETGHDFSQYRVNTLLRRINKRMAVQRIEKFPDYIQFLRQNPGELTNLFNEILIGVTQFFREPEAFEIFQKKVLPQLIQNRPADEALRVWVPGCSTGEEAYSLAIIIHEYISEHLPGLKVDIFATDIKNQVVEQARGGEYPASIAADVPEKYLNRYFTRQNHSYQIKSEIREMLIFAQQNLIKDPPFSKLDLVSCRNLLIYLKPEIQRKVLSLFQYALRGGGFLFLGPSENIAEFNEYFTPIDRKWRLFRRTEMRATPPADVEFFQTNLQHLGQTLGAEGRQRLRLEINRRELTERLLLEHFNPVGILINDKYDILYTHGPIDLYLKMVSGEAKLNVLDMARPGLQVEVTAAIRHALNRQETAYRPGIRVKTNGVDKLIDLTVKPVAHISQTPRLVMIIIEETAVSVDQGLATQDGAPPQADQKDLQLLELRKELEATKQYLQSTIEELQAANEEHRSFNEEIQSANEELQSTNEELTTSQEELQSVNEELVTANAEIESKNEALRRTNNDLHNLLVGTDIATIFLDVNLAIKRFTPAATKIINLIETDVGRPLRHTVTNLKYDALLVDAQQVLDTLNTFEKEVQTEDEHWYNMRVLPYRTVDNVIDGLVLTFAEITLQKEIENQLRRLNDEVSGARDYAQNIIDTLHNSMLLLNNGLEVESANRSFYEIFRLTRAEIHGKSIFELDNKRWDTPELRQRLAAVVAANEAFERLEIKQIFAKIGSRTLRLDGRQLIQQEGAVVRILLMIEDVSNQPQTD